MLSPLKLSGSSLPSSVTPEELAKKCGMILCLSLNIASNSLKQGGFLEGDVPVLFRLRSKYVLYADVRVCIRVLHISPSRSLYPYTQDYRHIIPYFFLPIIKENIRHVTKKN